MTFNAKPQPGTRCSVLRCSWRTDKPMAEAMPELNAHMADEHPQTAWGQRELARRRQAAREG